LAAVVRRIIPFTPINGHLTDIDVPIGYWRSVASSFNGFFFDTFIDEMAHAAGTDPLEFRATMASQEHKVSETVIPSIIQAQMISGAIYGFSAAAMGEITFENGEAQQYNFPDYDALRMHNTPQFEVAILENAPHLGGVGEPSTPPSMPALGNALFDLTGTRARDLPFIKSFDLLL